MNANKVNLIQTYRENSTWMNIDTSLQYIIRILGYGHLHAKNSSLSGCHCIRYVLVANENNIEEYEEYFQPFDEFVERRLLEVDYNKTDGHFRFLHDNPTFDETIFRWVLK